MQQLVAFVILNLFSLSNSANIICVFHFPSFSHKFVYQKIVKDLSARGHNVTVLTVYPINENYANVTEILINGDYDENFIDMGEIRVNDFGNIKKAYNFFKIAFKISFRQLEQPAIQNLIKEAKPGKFDLILMEYFYTHPLMILAQLYDCPIVTITPCETSNVVHSILGNDVNPAIYPELILSYEPGNMTLIQRVKSLIIGSVLILGNTIGTKLFYWFLRDMYLPNEMKLPYENLENHIYLHIQNIHPILNYPRSVGPKTIFLGNLHIEPPKIVNEGLKMILDASENGVIYISFGTNVNTKYLTEKFFSIFLHTFKQLNYDILWKLSTNHSQIFKNKPENIHISNWFPQADLLAHPKVKLFITHSGMLSVEEAIDREVPMLAIPFHLDHFRNAYNIRNEKIGVMLEYEELSEERLYQAIVEVMDIKYKENIKEFKKLINDVPMKSREKAIWWIEYVLRNKEKNFLAKSIDVPFYQKYFFDVIGLLVIFAVFLKKFLILMRNMLKNKVKDD